jgi:hypothetical protein
MKIRNGNAATGEVTRQKKCRLITTMMHANSPSLNEAQLPSFPLPKGILSKSYMKFFVALFLK